jgi:hypothetical protein
MLNRGLYFDCKTQYLNTFEISWLMVLFMREEYLGL